MLFLFLAAFLAAQSTAPETCSLTGTVVNSVTGDPLGKVDLRLEPVDRKATHVAVTRTDAQGHFSMVELESGTYHMVGQRSGYPEMRYGARTADGDGSVLRLEKGQALDAIIFKLTPAAVIAGTIRDSDGEPMEGAHVNLARLSYASGKATVKPYDSTDTDDRGEYRFHAVAAGKYYVGVEKESPGWDRVDHSAKAGPPETGVPTLYPGVTDSALATPVAVRAGDNLIGIDITLVKAHVYRVSGRVVNAPASGRATVELKDPQGLRDFPYRTSTKNAAGDFELRGVPPGAYDLTAGADTGRGKTAIVVGAADLDNQRVTLARGAEITFSFLKEGSDQPADPGLQVWLTQDGREGLMPNDADNVTVENVPPGVYALKVFGSMHGLYMKSARCGNADVLADGLTVSGPGKLRIEMVLAADGGKVQGMVRDKDQQLVSGATVVLAPDSRTRADLFRTTTVDQNGHYELIAVMPGSYKLFAWADVESGAWNDPDFLKDYEKQAEAVTIEPNGKVAVDVKSSQSPASH